MRTWSKTNVVFSVAIVACSGLAVVAGARAAEQCSGMVLGNRPCATEILCSWVHNPGCANNSIVNAVDKCTGDGATANDNCRDSNTNALCGSYWDCEILVEGACKSGDNLGNITYRIPYTPPGTCYVGG